MTGDDVAEIVWIDKRRFEKPLRVELGCGKCKTEGYIGIDKEPFPCVDIVYDLNRGIPLPDECAERILAHNLIEHLDDLVEIMGEIHRVLILGGQVEIISPHYLSPYAWGDPTHRLALSEVSMLYFTPGFVDRFGDYGIKGYFKIIEQEVRFAPYQIGDQVVHPRWPMEIRWVLEKVGAGNE